MVSLLGHTSLAYSLEQRVRENRLSVEPKAPPVDLHSLRLVDGNRSSAIASPGLLRQDATGRRVKVVASIQLIVTRKIGDKTLSDAPAFAKPSLAGTALCDHPSAWRYSKPHVKPYNFGYKNINKTFHLYIKC